LSSSVSPLHPPEWRSRPFSIAHIPIVLNRKNAIFAGHDEGAQNWACIASRIETCKLNGVDPQAYLGDVLSKACEPPARVAR